MYDCLDRPVSDLPAFERGVLDRMRRWVHALTTIGAPPATGGDPAFDDAMHALDRGSREDLVIQRPCHSTVDETEAVLVGLWRLVRAGRLGDAQATAAALVDAAHARIMVAAMIRTIERA